MDKKEILRLVGESNTDLPKEFIVNIRPFGIFQRLLMKIGVMKKQRVLEISPILVQNRWRVSTKAVGLPEDLFVNGTFQLNKAWATIKDHNEDFIYIVATCVQNDKREPTKALKDFIRWLPENIFLDMLDVSLSMAGVPNFMNSIILINGSNVLNVKEPDASPATTQVQ
ncbi:hypothetical protein N180_02750 [Pedobacter antarcticus 4BY]|uniref:Uncharacterized protein n=2 Tax=Pedobacter antarcticus TaxID=34086 RepID=A0A081PKG1_9SPHI|nr:hypothetical protein [Pedobacter antarcticus]KEQ31184.1 hypothetical protein N180_02750 [Pedobacter antarcticus 4BY]SFE54270.1 hypothetical protein SAMN03003324_00838 [Pedobacter antarcticus]